MKVYGLFLAGIGVFFGVIGVVYWFTSYEDAGSMMLFGSFLLGMLPGGYYYFWHRRMRARPRTEDDPNYEGVGKLLRGEDAGIRINTLLAGTLNVFAGRNTLHRVSKVRGTRSRYVAVYSYYDRPGVMFSDEERRGFYGRSA